MSKAVKKSQEVQVLPHDQELEKVVLGAILLEKTAFERVCDLLSPDDFYQQDHENVFSAMVSLARENQPIDLFSVLSRMKAKGTMHDGFGPFQLAGLTNKVTSTAILENHAMLLAHLSQRRKMYRICMDDASRCINPENDIKEVLQHHDGAITGLMNSGQGGNMAGVDDVVGQAIARIYELRAKDSHITGIPARISSLDQITHGWQDTDLIVLAARPAMGKTALALNLAKAATQNAHKPVSVAFFSLEMSRGQLINRILSSQSQVYMGNIVSGRVSNDELEQLEHAASVITKLPIFIDDTPGLGIMELKSKARRLKRRHNLGMLFIDYMQLVTDSSKNNREQEIGSISRQLKALAKELSIPVFALCQLSREVEKRSNKTPQLSDLRESGAIEQDADMVMFLYRPEYYGMNSDENGESNAGLCELNIAKHRNGELGTVKLRANLGTQTFSEWMGPVGKVPGSSFIPVGLAVEKIEQSDLPF